MGKQYYTVTYGCQMNESDTERINGQLAELGYTEAPSMEEADIVILNTCSIRQNAEEKVYGKIGEIKRMKEKNPDLLVGIMGCMAQENKGKLISRMPIIDFVLGPYHIHDLKDVVTEELQERQHVVRTQMNPERVKDYSELRAARKSHIFAWVPIMQGCNKFCTYCIVPMCGAARPAAPWRTLCGRCAGWPPRAIRKSRSSARMSIPTDWISGTARTSVRSSARWTRWTASNGCGT